VFIGVLWTEFRSTSSAIKLQLGYLSEFLTMNDGRRAVITARRGIYFSKAESLRWTEVISLCLV